MIVTLGSRKEISSTCWFRCHSCQESLEVSIGSGFDMDDAAKLAVDLGWYRRWFTESANVWFCSFEHAYRSDAAKKLDEYWYGSEDTSPSKNFWALVKRWFK